MRHLSESHLSKSRGRSKNAKQEEDEFESEMRYLKMGRKKIGL